VRVVVVGGGVIGASVAFHLAERGVTDVIVLDRGRGPAEGSTGRATGGFRAQFETDVNVRLSLLSREKLRRFAEEVGRDPGYEPRGYLWLAESDADLAWHRAALAVQHAAGLTEAVEVSVDDVRRLNPAIDCAAVVGGAFCPTDGFLRPLAMLAGYLEAAQRRGVRVEWAAEVVGFERAGDRISAVRTASARIECDAVVNAAGAWAGQVAALAGVTIPVAPLRRQALPTVAQTVLPADMPMTFFPDHFHLRVRDDRVLLLWPDPERQGFETRVDPKWVEAVTKMAHARVPALRSIAIDRAGAWAGLYEMTPDETALVGAAPGCPNLLLANGSSGHGVMHSPALGQLVAELVCGAPPSLDLAPLDPSRFDRPAGA
jgi:sarcosine oxidase, subunit beta